MYARKDDEAGLITIVSQPSAISHQPHTCVDSGANSHPRHIDTNNYINLLTLSCNTMVI
jgi:hypothetical protein